MNIQVQTREAIIEVLMSQGVSGSPGPYIPTFYQVDVGLHIGSSETSKVRMSLFQEKPINIQFNLFQHSSCLLSNNLCIAECLNAAALSSSVLPNGTRTTTD